MIKSCKRKIVFAKFASYLLAANRRFEIYGYTAHKKYVPVTFSQSVWKGSCVL